MNANPPKKFPVTRLQTQAQELENRIRLRAIPNPMKPGSAQTATKKEAWFRAKEEIAIKTFLLPPPDHTTLRPQY